MLLCFTVENGPLTDNDNFSDNNKESSAESSLLFAMSGDGQLDVTIPIVFLFFKEGQRLLETAYEYPELQVLLTYTPKNNGNPSVFFQVQSVLLIVVSLIFVGINVRNVLKHTVSKKHKFVFNDSTNTNCCHVSFIASRILLPSSNFSVMRAMLVFHIT